MVCLQIFYRGDCCGSFSSPSHQPSILQFRRSPLLPWLVVIALASVLDGRGFSLALLWCWWSALPRVVVVVVPLNSAGGGDVRPCARWWLWLLPSLPLLR